MPLLKHKGGSLTVTSADGRGTVTLHYGPGLDKVCPTCKVAANVLCVTKNGKALNKNHKARLG